MRNKVNKHRIMKPLHISILLTMIIIILYFCNLSLRNKTQGNLVGTQSEMLDLNEGKYDLFYYIYSKIDNSRYFSFKKYKVGSIIIKNKSENYNISLAFQNDGIINNIIKEAELTIGFNDYLFERKFEDTSFPYFYYEDNDYEYIISLVTRESGMDNSNFFNTENKIQKEYVLKILKKNSANAFSLEQDEKYQSYLQFYFFQ